jgi:2-phosphoglycerate kinase
VLASFLDQTRNVLVGMRAVIERALSERWSMVLEGVHLVPGLVPLELEGAIVTSCILEISDETAHAQHFFTREAGTQRPMAKYLDRFDAIRTLQEYLAERANATGTPVIENENAERATRAVAELVLSVAERERA